MSDDPLGLTPGSGEQIEDRGSERIHDLLVAFVSILPEGIVVQVNDLPAMAREEFLERWS